MTDKTAKNTKAFVIKGFKDAGTKESFTKGETVDLTEGQFGNYKAAGLVRAPDADAKATVKDKPAA